MVYPIRTIVAGVVDITKDDKVLVEAVRAARHHNSELHLVHAFELPTLTWDAYGRMGYVDPGVIERFAVGFEARLAEVVEQLGDDVNVRFHAVAAPPATAIHDIAAERMADLIIVGATRHNRFTRILLGSTAHRVLRRTVAPVLVVRGPVNLAPDRVLLTTDLSNFSGGVHELGLDVLETLADGATPELKSIMAVPVPIPLPEGLNPIRAEDVERKNFDEFLSRRRDRGRAIEPLIRAGEPADVIAQEAASWNPDYVVVGTHSRSTTERWLLGSVAEGVIRACGSNVLVVPAGPEEQRHLPVRRVEAARTGSHSRAN